VDSIVESYSGYEQEEGDDADADKRARGGSVTEREEKGEAALTSAGWAGPFATREREAGCAGC
jgi:hypothetical protein